MQDIFKIYSGIGEEEEIILAFKGDITRELLSSVYSIIESRLEKEHEAARRKKKFYNVVVECLQNVYHHTENPQEGENGKYPQGTRSATFFISRGKDNSLRIITGNFIHNSKCSELKSRIEKINGMNAEELRAYHLDKLSSAQLSEKGGAGLGIIEIARKSGSKLDYSFNKTSGQYSFFSLAVTVN